MQYIQVLSHVSTHTGKPEPLEAFSTWINRKPKRFFHFLLGPGWVFSPEKNPTTGQTFTLVEGISAPIFFPKSYTAYGPTNPANPPWKEHGSGQGWQGAPGKMSLVSKCYVEPPSLEKRVVPASKSFITLILILIAMVPQRLILGMRRCLAFD